MVLLLLNYSFGNWWMCFLNNTFWLKGQPKGNKQSMICFSNIDDSIFSLLCIEWLEFLFFLFLLLKTFFWRNWTSKRSFFFWPPRFDVVSFLLAECRMLWNVSGLKYPTPNPSRFYFEFCRGNRKFVLSLFPLCFWTEWDKW